MYCSPTSSQHSHQYTNFSGLGSSQSPLLLPHPLLKLMSLSATLPPTSPMLLKSGQGPPTSPIPIPSPSSNGQPESPKSSALTTPGLQTSDDLSYNNNNNSPSKDKQLSPGKDPSEDPSPESPDADEVLSIGGNDDPEISSSTPEKPPSDPTDLLSEPQPSPDEACHENDDTFSQKSHLSQSSSRGRSSESESSRVRKYSSEDSFSIRSLCSPASISISTSSRATPTNNGAQEESLRRASSSLLFSIANILRPDFGSSPGPFVPVKRSGIKSPPAPFGELYKPYNFLGSGHQSHGTNPIDLSRTQQIQRPPLPYLKETRKRESTESNGYQNHHKKKSGDRKSGNSSQILHPHKNGSSSHEQLKSKSSSVGTINVGTREDNSKSATLPNPKGKSDSGSNGQTLWPAWVYCTRYSDRPSSGPRMKRERKSKEEKEVDEKRPRTAFTAEQLARLKKEFDENRYLTEKRRQDLARELRLHENQIKIWFQNKRAKLKKASGTRGGLALQLMAQGLYNHSTLKDGLDDDDSDQ